MRRVLTWLLLDAMDAPDQSIPLFNHPLPLRYTHDMKFYTRLPLTLLNLPDDLQ